ncbi:MAG: ATP-binding protein [Luteimonas sp.]
MPNAIFHRPALAKEIADLALGRTALGRATTGVFLAAPRRTGKTTFLLQDLKPALEDEGVHVVYVDLWSNLEASPTALISHAIARDLAAAQGAVAKVAAGLKSVSIHGVSFELEKVGKAAGASLAEALTELRKQTGKPIALIVDEAQHVAKSNDEMKVMFALKSARDTMNVDGRRNLLLIMSGSDRDKLLRLVNSTQAPFFGAQIQELPALGADYAAHIAGLLVMAHPHLQVDNVEMEAAFARFVRRPEPFEKAIGLAASPLASPNTNFHARLREEADAYEAERDAQHLDTFTALSKLEQAVLTWMLEESPEPRLFTNDALAFYKKAVGRPVSAGSARAAVEGLRNREPPALWKSDRGDYALEDTDLMRWYHARVANKQWPPQ